MSDALSPALNEEMVRRELAAARTNGLGVKLGEHADFSEAPGQGSFLAPAQLLAYVRDHGAAEEFNQASCSRHASSMSGRPA